MHNVLISKEIPAIAKELLSSSGLKVKTLDSGVSLTSLKREELTDVHGIISLLTDVINEDFLNKCPNLKVISNYAVGINNLDLDELKKRSILVGNTPEVLTEATAELTVALILMTNRNLFSASSSVYQGTWRGFSPLEFLGPNLFRKNVSIMGFGRIGKKVGEILNRGFQCNIQTISRGNEWDGKAKISIDYPVQFLCENDFLKTADIIVLTAPLNHETKFWLNETRLKKLKDSVTIINTGRGDLVEEANLIDFLINHQYARFGTDVMSIEPLDMGHPFLSLKNATLLPHIGSATFEARSQMAEICAQNIILGLTENRVLKGPNLN